MQLFVGKARKGFVDSLKRPKDALALFSDSADLLRSRGRCKLW